MDIIQVKSMVDDYLWFQVHEEQPLELQKIGNSRLQLLSLKYQ